MFDEPSLTTDRFVQYGAMVGSIFPLPILSLCMQGVMVCLSWIGLHHRYWFPSVSASIDAEYACIQQGVEDWLRQAQ